MVGQQQYYLEAVVQKKAYLVSGKLRKSFPKRKKVHFTKMSKI
jgi:hypothetical protein